MDTMPARAEGKLIQVNLVIGEAVLKNAAADRYGSGFPDYGCAQIAAIPEFECGGGFPSGSGSHRDQIGVTALPL